MEIKFRVHTAVDARANVATEVDGATVQASIPCFEVELVTPSPRDGNLTLRFVGDKIADAKELFKHDAEVTFKVT